ncbi:hypothetical protein D9M68_212520 [compost metagenome]|uniref:Phosphodiesterase n=1 Tax=Pseudomonas jinjuensis TaxID=198616 RepID=A0A1H0PGJ8_9PSED|nr:phosphodiesterase [Pseudomonas jinjuensis]SDP04143.1 hypothetical protein SAMN05216193_12089 [Pseudomonas jinjuensis]
MRALALLLCLLCTPLLADVLTIPVGSQGDSQVALPARGDSKGAVLDRFGLPDEEHPAVGKPPITRWDYREFSVYFENERVIDAVRQHHPRPPIITEEPQ